MKVSKIISLVFILCGLAAIFYSISILSLYYLTGAKNFEKPDLDSLQFYYSWTNWIEELINVWIIAFLIWVAILLIVLWKKDWKPGKKLIWFTGMSFTVAIYQTFLSRIGVEWWNEYSLMIHRMYNR